jgi:lipoprotein-releasing system ATP-binding protein
MSNMAPLLQLSEVHKSYRIGPEPVEVLRGVSLDVGEGEFVAIMGASGSGKSTLLHIAGALDGTDSGAVVYRGNSVNSMYFWDRHALRNQAFGFVFQFYHLLPELNVLENVLLPAMVAAPFYLAFVHARPGKERALELLEAFGLSHRLRHRPNQLSGGERQRVAIARALINQPALLLADEPTGNLDAKTGRSILDVLIDLHKSRGQSILLVTHDPQVAALADRIVHLVDGRIKAK